MTTIPITFRRELPTQEGIFQWRLTNRSKVHKRFVYHDAVNALRCMGTLIEDIGGEWAGPLIENKEPGP